MLKNMDNIFSIFDMQKNIASTSNDFNIKNIISKLDHLLDVFDKYTKEILLYLNKEYSRPFWDSYKADIMLIKREISFFKKNVKKYRVLRWNQPLKNTFKAKSKTMQKPYGCCLMILNDLFPLSKIFIPIIGALSCGNTLFIKLPNYQNDINKLIKTIIKEVFNDNFVYFVDENLTDPEFRNIWDFNFDLVFFSGKAAVSKNLIRAFIPKPTKIVLDIFNKCPIIIDETADLEKTSKQIVWSKLFYGGQTASSPYYIVIHESIVKPFVDTLKLEYEKMFPKDKKWEMFSKMDTKDNFNTMINLIQKSQQKNKIILGGEFNEEERKIELTVVGVDDLKSPYLTHDITSPVLPMVIFNSFSDINGIVKHNDKPSSIYLFSKNKKRIKTLINDLESRYFFINNITMPYLKKYCFGGVKNSGTELYGGEESVKAFSYKKIIFKKAAGFDKQKFKSFDYKESKTRDKCFIK